MVKTRKKNKEKITTPAITKLEFISIPQLSKFAMTFWLGGMWMALVVIFPTLFKTLDQVTASELAIQTLNIQSYIGVICLIIAFIEVMVKHKLSLFVTRRFWYIISMFLILMIDYLATFPAISRLKSTLSSIAHRFIAIQSNAFDFWHSLSAILFVAICIIGILYLIET